MNIKMQRSIYRERQQIKESGDIHIPGIDVGGGWTTGCGSHPQSAEQVEELEASVWSVVRQENDQGVQNSGNLDHQL